MSAAQIPLCRPLFVPVRTPLRRLPFPSAAAASFDMTPSPHPSAAAPSPCPPTRVLLPSQSPSLLAQIDTLVLDCDGVLWRGTDLLAHARAALAHFRAQGKRLLFLTNNASKSRRQYVSKFASLGIEAAPHEIVAASYCAAAYLQSIGFRGKVLLVSDSGVSDELDQAGIQYVTLPPSSPQPVTLEEIKNLTLDPEIRAVVIGYDAGFDYRKIVVASAYVRDPSILFIGTNPDGADSVGNDRFMPGTGCLIAAVEAGSGGRRAFIVGKGGDWLFPFLAAEYVLDPARTAIVGDRLDTDIFTGRQGGLMTFLPLTGISQVADVRSAPPEGRPQYVMHCLGVLAGLGNDHEAPEL
jgi:phosphoglycolate phosphatase